ncbi:MAG: helix-turn-helix transcriptional regulator [Victivallales bacterium]|jgi:AraC-like DNA-binding protein
MGKTGRQDLFSSKYRRLLCSPGKLHLVSSLFPPDHEPLEDCKHRRWLEKNSDSHQTKEMLVVLEGNSFNSLNGLIYPATPGTIFLFDSYEKHDKNYSPATRNSAHLWICFLKHRVIARILYINRGKFDNAGKGQLILENSRLCDLLHQEWIGMKDSLLEADLKRRKMLSLLSLLFIGMIEQDISGNDAEAGDGNRQAKIIHAIHQHICGSTGKAMTVEKLARIAGYSKFHFFRLFKKHTGQNVLDCINESRLRKTREMLKEGLLQKQISSELGFSCPSAFSNWYARRKNS